MVKLAFSFDKFAKISGRYVLFDVAVFDLQYTLLARQIDVLSARSICTFVGKYNIWRFEACMFTSAVVNV
jgi:hypothetical protein